MSVNKRTDFRKLRGAEKKFYDVLKLALPNCSIQRQYPYKLIDEKQKACRMTADFAIPQLGIVIERQGEQHYKPIRFGGLRDPNSAFRKQKRTDMLKRKMAEENDWIYLEFHYAEPVDAKYITAKIKDGIDQWAKNKK